MSKSQSLFSIPERQSSVAVLLILWKFLRNIIRQVWFLVVILFFNPNDSWQSTFIYTAMAVAIGTMVLSILSYLKFYFYVKGDELIIEKGILEKKKLNIPIERIQTINFKQTILHQIFSVVEVEIDTAGSGGKELSITALTLDKAEKLREFLVSQGIGQSKNVEREKELQAEVELLRLEIPDLIKIGISQNHFRGAAIIFAFLFGLFEYAESFFGKEFYKQIEETGGMDFSGLSFFILVLLPFLVLGSLLVSLVNTMLKYFDLRFLRMANGFKVVSGLLTRKERSAKIQKIQLVRWSTGPLKQIFGLFDLNLSQAGSASIGRGQSLFVPGCYTPHLLAVRSAYFPEETSLDFSIQSIHKAIIQRYTLYFGVLPVFTWTAIRWFSSGYLALFWLLLIPFIWALCVRYHRNWKYEVSHLGIRTTSGIIGRQSYLLKWHKVQAVRLMQTPFQRRNDLANITFYTAAGSISIPYIELLKANELQDYVLYKIQTDNRKWM